MVCRLSVAKERRIRFRCAFFVTFFVGQTKKVRSCSLIPMIIDLPLIIGIAGMFLVLVGFLMVQTHRWTPDDMGFDLANLIGSGGLMYYAYTGSAWPFFILNGVFVAYSLKEVIVDLTSKKKR